MKVCMVLGHDLFDPWLDLRVYKEAKNLTQYKHDATVVCWTNENQKMEEST